MRKRPSESGALYRLVERRAILSRNPSMIELGRNEHPWLVNRASHLLPAPIVASAGVVFVVLSLVFPLPAICSRTSQPPGSPPTYHCPANFPNLPLTFLGITLIVAGGTWAIAIALQRGVPSV
jgi:hypothetical protein